MKLKMFCLLSSVFLFGCQLNNQKPTTGNITIINISKNYPKKEIRLQDIADVEYIPLETTDDVLLGPFPMLSYISDKYIVVWNMGQDDIFVFNRNGKIITYFNHKGQGSKEYTGISGGGVLFDEKNEEIFVLDAPTHRFLVYSISGEYKRILKYSTEISITISAYNFDEEDILIYDHYRSHRDYTNEKPYILLSKKDGRIVSVLNIRMPFRYSNRIVEEIDGFFTPISINISNNRYFGHDFVIADISSDTIYRLTQNKELTPLLVRKPSVHSSEPREVWTTLLTTDKFIILQKNTLDFISLKKGRPIPPVTLIHEFESGETSEVTFVDVYYAMRKWNPSGSLAPAIPKNMDARLIEVPRLKAAYEENLLNKDLAKLISMLDEDDNPIVMIVKFK